MNIRIRNEGTAHIIHSCRSIYTSSLHYYPTEEKVAKLPKEHIVYNFKVPQ